MTDFDSTQPVSADTIVVRRADTTAVVCSRARRANTFLSRLVGLLGRRHMEAEEGLYIVPCSGVHTFGMSMKIDVVTLDANLRVLAVYENTPPWVVRGVSLRTRSVLELAAGRALACRIEPGDQLALV